MEGKCRTTPITVVGKISGRKMSVIHYNILLYKICVYTIFHFRLLKSQQQRINLLIPVSELGYDIIFSMIKNVPAYIMNFNIVVRCKFQLAKNLF